MTTLDDIGLQPIAPFAPRSIMNAMQPASAPAPAQQAPAPIGFDDSTLGAFEDAAIRYQVPVNVLMALSEREAELRKKNATQEMGATEGAIQAGEAEQNAVALRRLMDGGLSAQEAAIAHFVGPDRSKWGQSADAYGSDVLSRAKRLKETYYSGQETQALSSSPVFAPMNPPPSAQQPGLASGRALDQRLLTAFEDSAVKYNVPVNVLMAMAEKDSGFDPMARSRGVGPRTRGIIGMSDEDVRRDAINPYMPEQSIDSAARKLRGLMDQGNLSIDDAVKAYVSGPDPSQWGPQAAEYANDVLGRTERLKNAYYPPEPAPEPVAAAQSAPAEGSLAGDAALQFGGGAVKGAGSIVHGAAEASQEIRRQVGLPEYRSLGDALGDVLENWGKGIQAGVSDETKQAIQDSSPSGDLFKPSTWTLGKNPSLRGYAALGLDLFGGMLPLVAGTVASGGSAAVGAVVGGLQGGGAASEGAREAIDKMASDGTIEKESAYYRQLIADGKTPDQALNITKNAAGRYAFIFTTPVSALGGAASAKILHPASGLVGGVKSRAGRAAGRAAIGAAEEGAQETGEQVTQNVGTNVGAGTDISPTDDTFGNFLLGALGGGAMGTGGGALSPNPRSSKEDIDQFLTAAEQAQRPGLPAPPDFRVDAEGNATPTAGAPAPEAPPSPAPAPSTVEGSVEFAPEAAADAAGTPPQASSQPMDAAPAPSPAPPAPKNEGPLSRVMQAGAPDLAPLAGSAGRRVVLTDAVEQMAGHIVGQDADGMIFKGDDGQEQLITHESLRNGEVSIFDAPDAPKQTAPRTAPPAETGPLPENVEKAISEEPAKPAEASPREEAAAKTEFTPKQPERLLSDMSEPELRERMKFLAQQAKAGGGWNKLLSTARREVEREIDRRAAGAKAGQQPAKAESTPAAPAVSDAKRAEAIERLKRDPSGWGARAAAQSFVDNNGLADTHEVAQKGKKFAVVEKAEEPKKSLPTDLAGAKPRYSFGAKQFTLKFASDIDRAAYVAAQKTPSKRDADYVKFVSDATGMTEAQVPAHGAKVREAIKMQARDANPGALNVGEVYGRAATTEQRRTKAESTPAISAAKPLDPFDATAKRFVGATVQPVGARVTVADEHGLMAGRIIDQSRDGVLFRGDDGEEYLFDNEEVASGKVRIALEARGAAPVRASKASIAASPPKGAPMAARALAEHLASGEDGPLIAKMIEAGKVRLHDDASTLPVGAGRPSGAVQGVTDPDGTIHLVAGNLTPETARAVLLHEVFHAGGEPLVGSSRWKALLSRVRTAAQAAQARAATGQRNAFDKFWTDALARASRAPTAHLAEEIAAYAIEHRESAPAGLREIADNIIGAVKAFVLRKFGRQFGDVTPGQLRALALAALRSWKDAPADVSTNRGVRYSMAGDGAVNEKREATLFGKAKNVIDDFVTNAMAGKVTPLALTPVRPLFLELAADLPSARHYLRAKELMDSLRNNLTNEVSPLVESWGSLALRFKADNRALMDLMHETTIAQIDPSKPFKDGDKAEYLALKKRYDAMPAKAREIYNEVRDLYEKRADESEREVIANMRRAIDAAVKRAEREHAAELQRIKDKGLTGKERDDAIAEADHKLKLAQNRTKRMRAARLKRLRQQFESNRLKGPYFPLARFGQFYVTVRDADGKVVSFSRFESASEQRAFADDMRKDKANKVEVGLLEEKTKAESFLDPKFVADVDAILEAGHASTTMRDQVWQRYLETLPDLSMRKSRIHRKNRAGYSTDALRAFASSMFHSAHQISRLRHGLELGEHLEEAGREVKNAKDPVRSGAVFNEMKKTHDFTMNPDVAPWSQNVTSAVFLWTMAANISSALVNLDQTISKGIPVLAFDEETGRVGMKQASAHLANAFIDFMRGKGFIGNSASLTADEHDAIAKSYERGVIDKTQAHDLAGVAERGASYNPLWAKFTKLASAPLHHTERLNREVTFLAAYRIARDAKLTHEQAIVKAGDLTWMTHYDNQASSKPRFMRGSGGRAVFALKSFQANVLFRVFRDAQQSWKGETEEARKAALGRFVSTLALTLPMAGLKGAFGMSMILAIAGLFMGDDDPEESLRKAVLEAAGDSVIGHAVGGMLMDGVPGYLTGTAISERVGMGDLWFRSNNRDLNAEQQFVYVLEQLGGAPIGIAHQVWQGADAIQKGDLARGIERVSPAFIRNAVKAGRYAREGVRDKDGNPVVEHVSPQDILKQLIGFTPAEVAERYARSTFQRNMQDRIKGERSQAMQAAARSRMADDDAAQESADAKVDRFNDRYPEKRITPKSIRQEIKRFRRKADRVEYGVDLDDRLEERIKDRTAPSIYSRE